MNQYKNHETKVREIVFELNASASTITRSVSKGFPAGTPTSVDLVSTLVRHEKWKSFLDQIVLVNEIEAVDFYQQGAHIIVQPRLIEGYNENYFSSAHHLPQKPVAHIQFKHRSHWMAKHYSEAEKISQYASNPLSECVILFDDMLRKKKNLLMVSGPMSSGGFNDFEKNIAVFHRATVDLSLGKGIVINSLPIIPIFTKVAGVMSRAGKTKEQVTDMILEEFYFPIMEKHRPKVMFQLNGWQESYGSTKEYKKALELMITCRTYKPSMRTLPIVYSLQ